MNAIKTTHVELTFDLSQLPRPSDQPEVAEIARRLEAAEAAATAVGVELVRATDAEKAAGDAYATTLGKGDQVATAKAATALDEATTTVARAKARLKIVGQAVEALRAQHAEVLEKAKAILISPPWVETRAALEACEKDLVEAAARVRGQLANLEQRQLETQTRRNEALLRVRFLKPWQARGGGAFNAGEVAAFEPREAHEIVAKGGAVFVDAWREAAAAEGRRS